MAQKSKQQFDYIAHVMRDGQTVEMAGTREDYTMKKVYQFLVKKATELGGWLITQHIEEAAADAPAEVIPKVVRTSQEDSPEVIPTFGAKRTFGKYTSEYPGASRLVFKETGNG